MDRECGVGTAGPYFDPFLEPNTISERWKAWIRNFSYYVDGQFGLSDRQKVARLLHQAGPAVQEIYESVKENDSEGTNEYEKCVNRLNSYFKPVTNTAYERQKFRNLEMQACETVDQFVLRIRKQAKYCEFKDFEEAIRDQLVEKCNSIELKRKFLKKGNDLTLASALEIARLFEMENDMFKEKSVKVEQENTDSGINRVQQEVTCFRCGRKGHLAKDSTCPAISEKCQKCGIRGHFAKRCKTKLKQYETVSSKKGKKRYVKYVIQEESTSESESIEDSDDEDLQEPSKVYSVFEVSNESNKCDIQVGEQKLPCRFIIDSGASVDIIDRHTFKKLVKLGLCCKLNIKQVQKYFSYGGKEIAQLGMFKTTLYSPDSKIKTKANILVYNGCGPSLLSKQTSIQLGLLRIGPITANSINILNSEPLTKEIVMKEYPELFKGIGKLKDFKLKIPIDPNVKLVAQPIRRQPFNMRPIEENLIKELLENDIIEPVTGPTPCVSPSHLVKKKEQNQYRLVVDMRKANEAVLREHVPLPTFEELLADLNGCKYFSSLDIKWGYHQLELDEDSKMITVFSCSLGLFRYKRLCFGIRCASEMFQRVLSQLLQGIDGVANSQDDIRVGGRTREEHDSRLRQVLKKLHANGITLNEKKCSFGVTEINFLGHHLSDKGIKPTKTSQQVVQAFRAPQNKAEVRSFLGLVNFSARFIPNFSTLTEPLRQLTKKDADFVWTQQHERAFQQLKTCLAQAPALGYYDNSAKTTLVADASPVGIAAVLIQHQHIGGELQPIVIKYISKALSPTEQRYSQTEKEALAIVWACESLYMYLIGKEFNIISDHKPLEIIYSSNSKPSARIQRWVLRLQPFTFKVIFKPGKSNIADPLSRLLDTNDQATKNTEDNEDQQIIALVEETIEAVTIKEVQEATIEDEELCSLKEAIEKDIWPKELRKYELIKTELCIVNDIILRGTRIVIPRKLIPKIMELGHEGHLSINSMKAKLRMKVWWKGLDKDVEHWVDTCEGCRLVRKNTHPEPIVSTNLPSKVWELVAIDFLGPLPSGHYLLFVVDYYSRYFEVEICKNQTAEITISTLEKIITREGIMDEIVCDNGPAFRDAHFKQFLKTYGIRLRHTTPLWPQANGEVERQNRNVLRRLQIAQAMKLDWKKELLVYLMAYRTTPHSTTGVPPGNVFKGRNIKSKLPEMKEQFNLEDEKIRDEDRYKKDIQKQYADKRRNAKITDINPGDKVLIKQRKENKLTTPFSPVEHTVLWKSGNSVAVRSPDGKTIHRNSSHFKPVKRRDMKRFSMEERPDLQEKDMNSNDKEGTDNTNTAHNRVSVDKNDTPDSDMTMTRPSRNRHTPVKYKDFLLGLILETLK